MLRSMIPLGFALMLPMGPAADDDRQTLAQGQLCDLSAQQDDLTFQVRRS